MILKEWPYAGVHWGPVAQTSLVTKAKCSRGGCPQCRLHMASHSNWVETVETVETVGWLLAYLAVRLGCHCGRCIRGGGG